MTPRSLFSFILISALSISSVFAQTFNLREYFPLGTGDTWHLIGDPNQGGTPEDDFRWTVLAEKFAHGSGRMLTQIQTVTDEPTDSRNGDKDLWYVVPSTGISPHQTAQDAPGALLFYGIVFGSPKLISGIPISQVILSDPIFVGGDGSAIGGNNGNDTGLTTVNLGFGPVPVTITSTVNYVGLESITVPIGTFHNVLHLTIDLKIQPPATSPIELRGFEVWLGHGQGLLQQDQDISAQADVQVADEVTVNGMPVGCLFTIDPQSANFSSDGGPGSVTIFASEPQCEWSAISNDPWITITSAASDTGSGSLTYSVAPNPDPIARTGSITVAGKTHTVNQAALCSIMLDPSGADFPRDGGFGAFSAVINPFDCAWEAESTVPWITITSPTSGSGSTFINYEVASNPGFARQGAITIGNQSHTVNQAAACMFIVGPLQADYAHTGGSGQITVTASDTDCAWSAVANVPWITITAGAFGVGSGTVSYFVEERIGQGDSGTITVAGMNVLITRATNPEFDLVVNYILGAGALTPDQAIAADANFDGRVDVADLITINEQRGAPFNAVRWISPVDGDWNVGSNWSTNSPPTSTDIVVIDTPGAPVTVTISTSVTVADLRMPGRMRLDPADNLTLSGATLTVTGPASVGGLFTAQNNALLVTNGASARFSARDASITNSRIQVRNGGQVSFPSLTEVVWNTNQSIILFDVFGTNSLLDLPNLESLTYTTGIATARTARIVVGSASVAGGKINLPALSSITAGTADFVQFESSNGGMLDISALPTATQVGFVVGAGSTLSAPSIMGTLSNSTINVTGGTLSIPGVTALDDLTFTVNGQLDAPDLASITNTSMNIGGEANFVFNNLASITRGASATNPNLTIQGNAVVILPALTTLTDMNLTVNGNASVNLPALETYTVTNQNVLLSILNGTINFSAGMLSDITNLRLVARGGGALSLPAVTSYLFNLNVNPILFDVDSAGTIDLPNLTTINYLSGFAGARTARITSGSAGVAGGNINLPELTTIVSGTEDFVSFESANAATLNIAKLATTTRLGLVAAAGGDLTAPAVAGTLTNSTVNIASGGTLTLPLVTAMEDITFTINGAFNAPNLQSISASAMPISQGAALDLPMLTSISRGAAASNPLISVLQNVSLNLPALTTITDMNLTINNNASVSFPQLSAYTATNASATLQILNSGASLSASMLSDITNLKISLRAGAMLSLPAVTSYIWNINTNPLLFDVQGAGSSLNLQNLTALTFDSQGTTARTARITAGANVVPAGFIDLSGWQTVTLGTNDSITVTANGAGSTIDLSSLTPLPAGITLDLLNGGTIINP